MFHVELSATERNVSGKGPMRQLRMKGLTPAVVYGNGDKAQMLQLETKELHLKLLEFYRKNTVVSLNIDGKSKNVRFGELQTDPIKDTLLHIDFCEIDLDKVHRYNVPVVCKGKAKGVDLGGDLVVFIHSLELSGKPLDIPNEVEVNISDLAIGDKITCSEIPLPDNVTLNMDGEEVVVTVEKP